MRELATILLRQGYGGTGVMCRGNGGKAIYKSDKNRELFLKTLWECCKQTGWIVHAYVLMKNHLKKQVLAWLIKRHTVVTGEWIRKESATCVGM